MRIRFILLVFVTAALAACEPPDETFRATAYSEIVRAQMAAGDTAGARRTVELALQAVDEDDDKFSRDITIAAAAVAQVRVGDLAGAEETQLRASGPEERGLILHLLALALDEAGQKLTARRTAEVAGELAKILQPEKNGPQYLAFSAWVLARTGDITGARQIEERIADADIRDKATALIAWAQAEAGDASGALTTLERIRSPESMGGGVASIVIVTWGIAIDVHDTFDEYLLYADMYGDQPLQTFAWYATALAFAETGDMDGARQAFDGAIKAAYAVNDLRGRVRLLAATGLAQAEVGDRKSAHATLDSADALLLQAESDAITDIDRRKTVQLVDAVRSAVDGKTDITELTGDSDLNNNVEFLVQAAIFQIRLNNLDGASASLDWLVERQSDELRELSLLVAGLGSLAVARFEAGDTTRAHRRATQALEIAQSIPKTDNDRILAMFFASVALARVGDIDSALSAATEIQEREKPAQ